MREVRVTLENSEFNQVAALRKKYSLTWRQVMVNWCEYVRHNPTSLEGQLTKKVIKLEDLILV